MDLKDLYRDVILDHNKRPRNFGRLDPCDTAADGNNPLCGDRLTVTLNDKLVIDNAQLPGVSAKGSLALQLHPERHDGEWGVSLVQFRNIWIKELTAPK